MNENLMKAVLGIMLAASFCHAQTDEGIEGVKDGQAEATDKVAVLFGGGFVYSPGYGDFIDDTYVNQGYEDSGLGGWLDLYMGVEYKALPQVSVIGGCDLMLNAVDVSGGALDETYLNAILNPSLYGQFFTEARSFYVNGGISLPIPSTGSDYFEYENNGVGWGGHIGYASSTGVFRIEVGYVSVPVTAKASASNPVLIGEEEYDFGGFQLKAMVGF
ncbi:MAG: hypothetical protein K9M54_02920 [Kiritimatiellales bacterium]|nr:hypothetical protein [Kiritimatiellales bacterium]MCF7864178.1 hypothetical protein [Kiritimatiellales bacterium]